MARSTDLSRYEELLVLTPLIGLTHSAVANRVLAWSLRAGLNRMNRVLARTEQPERCGKWSDPLLR